jgi:hypothetical protein
MSEGRHLIRIGFGPALRDGRVKAEHMEMILDQMPDDTNILGFDTDYSRDTTYMVLEHPDFPLTTPGQLCKEVTAVIKQERPEDYCEVSFLMDGQFWNPCAKEDARHEMTFSNGSKVFFDEASGLTPAPNFLAQSIASEKLMVDYGKLEKRVLADGLIYHGMTSGRITSKESAIQNIARDCNCKYDGWKFHVKDCPAHKTGPV